MLRFFCVGGCLRGNGVSFSAREGKCQPPARENAAFYARIATEYLSARERGIFFSAGREIPAACAGICRHLRPDCYGVSFCAGKGYLFQRGKGNTSRLRGKSPLFPPGLPRSTFLRGNGVSFSARNFFFEICRE